MRNEVYRRSSNNTDEKNKRFLDTVCEEFASSLLSLFGSPLSTVIFFSHPNMSHLVDCHFFFFVGRVGPDMVSFKGYS